MFQLLEFVFVYLMGPVILSVLQDTIYLAVAFSECDECGFNDLGKLLFGGVILAAAIGIAVSLFYRRARERRGESAAFVSIRSSERREK